MSERSKRLMVRGMALVIAGSALADTQRAVTATFTNEDAKAWIPAFRPLLEADRAETMRDTEHPDRMGVAGMQPSRLQDGSYQQLLVKFEMHREAAEAIAATRLTGGVLPENDDDKVTIATCGPLPDSDDFATVDMTYVREQGKWLMDSKRYHRVRTCVVAAALLDRA